MKSELDEVASENLKSWRTCSIHMVCLLRLSIAPGERPKWGMTLEANCRAWCNARVAVRRFACGINAQQTKGRQKETQKSHPEAPNKRSFDEWRQKSGPERAELTDLLMGFAGLGEHVFVWCAKNKELWLHNENSINHWTHHRAHKHHSGPMPIIQYFCRRNLTLGTKIFLLLVSFLPSSTHFNSGMTRIWLISRSECAGGGGRTIERHRSSLEKNEEN